jgi:ArsR family transcriptional regulator, arsenate/arsenite/antimonite-responsive transcriptional repressor
MVSLVMLRSCVSTLLHSYLSISTFVNMLVVMKRQTDPDVRLLQAAADPTRLAILRQLSDVAEVCACDFTACCEVSQPTVSHHLKVLREAGWIEAERRGSWVWYSLRPQAAARFRELAGLFGGPSAALPARRRLPVVQPSTPVA